MSSSTSHFWLSSFPFPPRYPPSTSAYRTDQPIQVDGRLDEVAWNFTAPLDELPANGFLFLSIPHSPPYRIPLSIVEYIRRGIRDSKASHCDLRKFAVALS